MKSTRGAARRTPLSRRRMLRVVSLGAMGTLLTGCGTATLGALTGAGVGGSAPDVTDFSARFAEFEAADEPNGDLSKVVWPEWMGQLDPEIKTLYEFQIRNGPLMRYMPCFCGCQWEDGHQNNRDCYVDTVNSDGSVVFDAMAPT